MGLSIVIIAAMILSPKSAILPKVGVTAKSHGGRSGTLRATVFGAGNVQMHVLSIVLATHCLNRLIKLIIAKQIKYE